MINCGKWPMCEPYADWEGYFGQIMCAGCARALVLSLKESFKSHYIVGATSCPGDPIHPGHISAIQHAAMLCSMLIVIVNGDEFLRRKKGAAFMPLKARSQIIASISTEGSRILVVPFEATDPADMTVNEALMAIMPDKFIKGGDRKDAQSIPEWEVCKKIGTELVTGVGDEKYWSSSNFLQQWDDRKKNKSAL